MYKVMKGLSVVSVIAGVLGAVIFILFIGSWLMAFAWLIGGAITGITLYTLGEINEIAWENNALLREVLHRLPESQGERKPPLGNSKANLSALNNYKMNVKDQR